MPSGDSYQDGEENGSLGPAERAEPAGSGGGSGRGTPPGSGGDERRDENGGEPSGGEQGQEDVEMNSDGGALRHPSSADERPGSTTGSGSTKR